MYSYELKAGILEIIASLRTLLNEYLMVVVWPSWHWWNLRCTPKIFCECIWSIQSNVLEDSYHYDVLVFCWCAVLCICWCHLPWCWFDVCLNIITLPTLNLYFLCSYYICPFLCLLVTSIALFFSFFFPFKVNHNIPILFCIYIAIWNSVAYSPV